MIHLYTGDGKGKTTSAIGCAIRMAGYGKNVIICQFLKGSVSGEIDVLNNIDNIKLIRNLNDYGFFINMSDEEKKQIISEHNTNVDIVVETVIKGKCSMVILDEVTDAWNMNCVDRDKIDEIIKCCEASDIELILTGHFENDYFTKKCDYHTVFKKIKHPFDNGVLARPGIEY